MDEKHPPSEPTESATGAAARDEPSTPSHRSALSAKGPWYGLLVVVVALLVIGGWQVSTMLMGTGSSALERWIGGQVAGIINEYLEPQLSIGDLNYTAPFDLELSDVKLVADAPDLPGGTLEVFTLKRAEVTLGAVPRVGEPLVIQRVVLTEPMIHAVAIDVGQFKFHGFDNLIKRVPGSIHDQGTQFEGKLSDIFHIREIKIINAKVKVDTREEGVEPMVLDQLTFDLQIDPDPNAKGWYKLDTTTGRAPIYEAEIKGRFNLDDMAIEAERLALEMTLNEDTRSSLPPQLQKLVAMLKLKAMLNANVSGALALQEWRDGRLSASVNLSEAFVTLSDRQLRLDQVTLEAQMRERKVVVDPLMIRTLEGEITGEGISLNLNDFMADASIAMKGLRAEKVFVDENKAPLAGKIDGKVTWKGPVTDPTKQSDGGGELHISDGLLDVVPVVSTLEGMVGGGKKDDEGRSHRGDSADFVFEFRGDRVVITESQITTTLVHVEGGGDIKFDTTLDLLYRGGPLRRMGKRLGIIGKAVGDVVSQMSSYRIGGTATEPKVSVKAGPLGG